MSSVDDAATPAAEQTFAFKAEIRQLLDILIHSLYTEREIFLRELISNASDALNRLRFEMLTRQDVLDPEAELAIRLQTDKDQRLLVIEDTGIGMTAEELISNLGTIAHSGARAFIQAAKEKQGQALADVIGQFGVGFYSVFMVAESVRVISRSYLPEAQAAEWRAAGDDRYQLFPAERNQRGTRIEITLKEEAAEFLEEPRLREIVRRHSDFVAFPIYLNDKEEKINQQAALWRTSAREVTEEQYNDFFKQLTLDFEQPLLHLHINTDAPVQMYALLYVPRKAERTMFSLRKEDGLKLYARKVLIQEYSRDLLPEYLRFVQGVVDSEDLPLNVSREAVQSTAVMNRIKKVLTGKLLGALKEMAVKQPDDYKLFWEAYGHLIKEGIAMLREPSEREPLLPLLRFHTSKLRSEWSSLAEITGRMKAGQKSLYYLMGDDPRSVFYSPHLEAFERSQTEVIVLTDPIDAFMLLNLQSYEGFNLVNIAAADVDAPEASDNPAETPASMPEDELNTLIERFKAVLGERVADVRTSTRLAGSVARLVDPQGSLNPEMQRVYRMVEKEFTAPKKVLELNPGHAILAGLQGRAADDALAVTVIEQIYESALLVEGLHPDPAGMIQRIQALMEAAVRKG